jgi:hypothetical protein
MPRKRRLFSAEIKTQVGQEALQGLEPIHVIKQRYEVHIRGRLTCGRKK